MWENEPETIEDYLGFVYLITAPNGRMYVGKKLFWTHAKLKPLKGQTRNRRKWKETDWRKYWGSSADLVADRKRYPEGWRKEILHCGRSKWELAWVELQVQAGLNVLWDKRFYNSIIHIRLNAPPRDLPVMDLFSVIEGVRSRLRTRRRVVNKN